jgi:HD-like signal output (HDOD) protein
VSTSLGHSIGTILKEENVDDLFLMGLTHDIGKVMLFKPFTDILAQTESIKLDEVMESIQEAHCGIGSAFLAKLGFSEAFVSVGRMHDDEKFSEATLKYILIVSLANILTRKIGYSLHEGTDIDLAEVNPAKLLKLDTAELEDVCAKVKQTMEAAASKF